VGICGIPKLRAGARRIEARLGLTATGPAEGTAAKAPARGELAKARREFRAPTRTTLRAAVRRAALRSSGVEEFVTALEAVGMQVQLRRAPSGDPIGYAVAQPEDLLAPGEPVFYSGSKLAPDLSLPKLTRRWGQHGTVALKGRARQGTPAGSSIGPAWDLPGPTPQRRVRTSGRVLRIC
jgi:hypothetical protein